MPFNFIGQQTKKYGWGVGAQAWMKSFLGIEVEQAYSGNHPHVLPFTGSGSFWVHVIKGTYFPICFGLLVHKIADVLGINDELEDAGVPINI